MVFNNVHYYNSRIFRKLNLKFNKNWFVLDAGCGDGGNALFIADFVQKVIGVDVKSDKNWRIIKQKKQNIEFKLADIRSLPFQNKVFDLVFIKDVLHHTDNHQKALQEIKRVTKENGIIVIIEANRYNPISFFYSVKMLGHQHWRQSYFKKAIEDIFSCVEFKFFEAHAYPWMLSFWKIYEELMEILSPKQFLSYNTAIIKNKL